MLKLLGVVKIWLMKTPRLGQRAYVTLYVTYTKSELYLYFFLSAVLLFSVLATFYMLWTFDI